MTAKSYYLFHANKFISYTRQLRYADQELCASAIIRLKSSKKYALAVFRKTGLYNNNEYGVFFKGDNIILVKI